MAKGRVVTLEEAKQYVRDKIKAEVGDFHGCATEAARRWGLTPNDLRVAVSTSMSPCVPPSVRKCLGIKRTWAIVYTVPDEADNRVSTPHPLAQVDPLSEKGK